jgi:hypothetical protein
MARFGVGETKAALGLALYVLGCLSSVNRPFSSLL